MKIIITGCLGHIGSALIRELPNLIPDCEITGIDNFRSQRYCSLFNLPKDRFTFVEGDVRAVDLISLFSGCDVVIHLAAITDAASSFDNAQELEDNNFISTKAVAEACNVSKVRLISLSTTSVYGTQNRVVNEDCDDEELNPQSPYAVTKLKEEKLLESLSKDSMGFTCLRFGTIFGKSPGMRFHTAVNKFCWQASNNTPITVWSSAYDQVRPYLSLDDAVAAFVHVIKSNLFGGYQLFNVLTGNYSVKDVVKTIEIFCPRIKIAFVDSQIMNQLSYHVSSDKFKDTGFMFRGSLKRSIKETIELLCD